MKKLAVILKIDQALEAMPTLLVYGLNHHGSPVAERERVSMPAACLDAALQTLQAQTHIDEAVILSTCNRTEVYAVASSAAAGIAAIEQFLQTAAPNHKIKLRANLKLLQDDAALQLFRVASGLDSIITGEGQILGQVKQALKIAQQAGTAGPYLNKLFSLAAKCGKEVRTRTGMSQGAVSVASAAVEMARHKLGSLQGRSALIIGAGRIATLCARQLAGKKNGVQLCVLNRTEDSIKELQRAVVGANISGETDFNRLPELIAKANMVFVATAADHFIIRGEHLAGSSKNTLLFDLSVPRNIDSAVLEAGFGLTCVDDLEEIVANNLQERQRILLEAEPIVFNHLDAYKSWMVSHAASPAISRFRQQMHELGRRTVRQTTRQLKHRPLTEHDLDHLSTQLINKITHAPTLHLRGAGGSFCGVLDMFELEHDR